MGYGDRPQQPPLRTFGGLNTRDSELGLPGNDSPYMMNVDLHPEGSIKMRAGCSAASTPTGEDQINAVMRVAQPEQDRGWIYLIADNTIYRAPEPGTWTWQEPTHLSGYTLVTQQSYGRANSRYYDEVATEHPSVLYLPRSNGAPLIALGQTSATGDIITLPTGAMATSDGAGDGVKGYPPDWTADNWPTYMRLIGLGRGSRMFAWGFNDHPHMIAYSELDVPYNYIRSAIDTPTADPQPLIDGGYVMIREGDGDKITAVVDMFGYKVIFKRNTTTIYVGDPGNDATWSIQAEFPVGCVSDRAWVKVGNDVLFWSSDGPRALSAVQEYGDLANSNVAFKINELVRVTAPGSDERICCYHDITNMRVVWFTPSAAATHNDTCFVFYYNTQKWTKWDGAFAEMMDVQLIRSTDQQSDRVLGGSYENGLVHMQQGFSDANIDASTADSIESDYITNWINTGEISDATRVLSLDVLFGDDGPVVDIYYQTDLNAEWKPITRVIKSMGGQGTFWTGFAWGTAAWGATARAFRRYEADALFNLVRFKFIKTGKLGFEVMGYRLEARQKGLRA